LEGVAVMRADEEEITFGQVLHIVRKVMPDAAVLDPDEFMEVVVVKLRGA
jgi:hypothetical protein